MPGLPRVAAPSWVRRADADADAPVVEEKGVVRDG